MRGSGHGHSHSMVESSDEPSEHPNERTFLDNALNCASVSMDILFGCISAVVNMTVGWLFPGEVTADKKLKVAIVVALFFMFVEIIGGVLANSLAIVVDAAHMLSDVCGYIISMSSERI